VKNEPRGNLILKCLAPIVAFALLAPSTSASQIEVLYTFKSVPDGHEPFARPILMGGKLYGTTRAGGIYDQGIVYQLQRTRSGWTKSTVYTFTGGDDGGKPWAELVHDKAGNLYGTAPSGGASGDGVVFELSPNSGGSWTETVLHTFTGSDGAGPLGGLIWDGSGNLYGTTSDGGAHSCDQYSQCGTVFKLSHSNSGWILTTLHSFDGSDGWGPASTLLMDANGNLFGTTRAGGHFKGSASGGVLYELSPSKDGWSFRVLCKFTLPSDPGTGRIAMCDKRLYGTNAEGGAYGSGFVYRVTPSAKGRKEHTIYSFTQYVDGDTPFSGVVCDTKGNLYGTTLLGGAYDEGTVFKLTLERGKWIETVLGSFTGLNGYQPAGGLTWDEKGHLYGTADGGAHGDCSGAGCGVVFEITP